MRTLNVTASAGVATSGRLKPARAAEAAATKMNVFIFPPSSVDQGRHDERTSHVVSRVAGPNAEVVRLFRDHVRAKTGRSAAASGTVTSAPTAINTRACLSPM